MSSPRIVYTPRPDATLETELDALASVYKIVVDCGERRRAEAMKKAPRPGSPDDAEGTRIAKGGAM